MKDVIQQFSNWNPLPLFSVQLWSKPFQPSVGVCKGPHPLPKSVAVLFRRSWHILCYAWTMIWEYESHILCKTKGFLKSYLSFRPLKAREKSQSLHSSLSNMVGKPTTGKGQHHRDGETETSINAQNKNNPRESKQHRRGNWQKVWDSWSRNKN